jgi:predicted nucleotidyltransferase
MTAHPHPDPGLILRLRTALEAAPRVRLAVLFGSSVSGRMRPDSDVDVAILTAELDPDDAFEAMLNRELTLAARTDVDLIRIDRASTLLKRQIATGGVLLVPPEIIFRQRFKPDQTMIRLKFHNCTQFDGIDQWFSVCFERGRAVAIERL